MLTGFRFFLICRGATQRLEDRLVTLSGIVDEIETNGRDPIELAAVVGVVLSNGTSGKCLDLLALKTGPNTKPERIPGHRLKPLILPDGIGPQVLPFEITIPIREAGVYAFRLYDRDGAFGPSGSLLATYLFGVNVSDSIK